ncbi:FAD-binding protein [Sorangium sp. So ce1099]|uniref:FAD-binding protein n=1 Tax=Sorangium sp. So ce1099 TaxID=3133331 RepID=UPI003F5E750B
MARSILVIGAGVAGLAAAWSARRRGARVTVISAGVGETALAGGAVDDVPWEQVERAGRLLGSDLPAGDLAPAARQFAAELGLWDVPHAAAARIATVAGRIRPARGRDRALLDLGPLRRTRVLVPRVPRAAWDADALAEAFTDEPFARARGLRFLPVDAPFLRFDDERGIADGDLAARHDDPARLSWLLERLHQALEGAGGAGAILLGPWLGARAPRAEALSARLGVPVGEALIGAGSPAGLRFEAARDALLAAIEVTQRHGRVRAVAAGDGRGAAGGPGDGVLVHVDGEDVPLAADAVILAIGGLAGGGVAYAPPERGAGPDLPARGAAPFALSIAAPVTLGDARGAFGVVSSMQGPELDLVAWPRGDRLGALEAVGVRCEGVRAAPGILVAGATIAGRARTVLDAVTTGLRAGAEA